MGGFEDVATGDEEGETAWGDVVEDEEELSAGRGGWAASMASMVVTM